MTLTRADLWQRLRRLADLLATPLAPADFLDLINPLRPGADLRGRVVAVRPETADAVTLAIRPGADWRGHLPGQHVRVGVDVDGVRHHRTYSLTSAPGEPLISITPKRVEGGLVSTHLVRRARPGDLVHLGQAEGDFRVPPHPVGGILFLTAGSGITPVLGMLRSGLAVATDLVWIHCDRQPEAMVARAEMSRLAAGSGIRLIERHTAVEGRLTMTEIARLVPDWADRETWACGPAALLDALSGHWAEHGSAERLHVERFTAPVGPAGGDGGAVTFARSSVAVEVAGGTSLLQAGEEAGVLMPSGCRMGICHGCLTPLRSGSVRDLRTGTVVSAPGDDPLPIQTCITTAAGPVLLDR